MAIVTTYVCDVSGLSGTDKKDFIDVRISADNSNVPGIGYSQRQLVITKLLHISVARKLNLVSIPNGEELQPEVTIESKLAALMKDYIQEIAYEAGAEAARDRN